MSTPEISHPTNHYDPEFTSHDNNYKEVLVVRVHPELLDAQGLPPIAKRKNIWEHRFEKINNFEKYLVRNGIVVLKFFLFLKLKRF